MSRVQESIQLQLQEEVDWAIFNVQQTGMVTEKTLWTSG